MSPDDYAFIFGFSVALPLGFGLAFLWLWVPEKRQPIQNQYDPEA